MQPPSSQEKKWAFSALWKKLHFGHISGKSGKEANWKGMEASYRYGLDPFRRHVLKQISARIERKKLMTFQMETPVFQPIRAKLTAHACIITVPAGGSVRQVIRDWPKEIDVGNHTIFDGENDEYVKIQNTRIRNQTMDSLEVEIFVDQELIGNQNLILKGHPIIVHAEAMMEEPKSLEIRGKNYPVIESVSSADGEKFDLIVPVHNSEIKNSDFKHHKVLSIKSWKPRNGTELRDGSKIIVENWSGNDAVTFTEIPEHNSLFTSEGISVSWQEIQSDGVWVKPTVDVENDAVLDPVDTLFEDNDIRELTNKERKPFKILERNRELRILRLADDPRGQELHLSTFLGDLLNQKSAIERLQGAPLAHHVPLMDLTTTLNHKHIKPWPQSKQIRQPTVGWKTRVSSGSEGSSEQQNFILKALSSQDFSLLEGPPGSGKTETIGELILQLLSDTKGNPKILLCGNTQASVDNVLSRFGYNDLVQPLRLVNSKRWRKNPDDRDQLVYDSEIHQWTEPEQVDDLKQRLGSAGKNLTEADLSDMVFRRSNLVCATMGTVIQHPHIKKVLSDRESHTPPKALFDILIIDEASKTTFTEFLIPAIFCKKWVLVGDVAQLPPFTNQDDIAGMLDLLESKDGTPAQALRKACLNIQNITDDYHMRNIPRLLVEKAATVKAMQEEWGARLERGKDELGDRKLRNTSVGFLGPDVKEINEDSMRSMNTSNLSEKDWERIGGLRLSLHECDLIVIAENLAFEFGDLLLSNKHITRDMMEEGVIKPTSEYLPNRLKYRLCLEKQRLMRKFEGYEKRKNPFNSRRGLNHETTTWGKQVAWRIQRVYEMQTSENLELRRQYLNATKSLLPCSSNTEEWALEVERIRCFSLPSILESLQYGFMGKEGRGPASEKLAPQVPTTLSNGFSKEAKASRFESIRHQHRMHWSISKFPRNEFYGVHDGQERLQDANSTLNARPHFGFILDRQLPLQQERRFWIDVPSGFQDKTGNLNEVSKAMNLLDSFLNWFDSTDALNLNSSSIVLLTPYVNQSRLLRQKANEKLQRWNSMLRGTRATVHFSGNRKVTVFCSTIDKFQGQEADVVVLSLRNVSRQGNIDSPNRANVGLTRAREAMFVIGKKQNYVNAYDPMLKRLATDMALATKNTYWRIKNEIQS